MTRGRDAPFDARPERVRHEMKFAYADPPYLGWAFKLYGDATYDDARAHRTLIQQLVAQYPDGVRCR